MTRTPRTAKTQQGAPVGGCNDEKTARTVILYGDSSHSTAQRSMAHLVVAAMTRKVRSGIVHGDSGRGIAQHDAPIGGCDDEHMAPVRDAIHKAQQRRHYTGMHLGKHRSWFEVFNVHAFPCNQSIKGSSPLFSLDWPV